MAHDNSDAEVCRKRVNPVLNELDRTFGHVFRIRFSQNQKSKFGSVQLFRILDSSSGSQASASHASLLEYNMLPTLPR